MSDSRTSVVSVVRVAGRLALVSIVACVLGLVAVQFEAIVAKNVAIAREISGTRADIAALRERKGSQLRTIRRLSDPAGAVPEIHEKLRLVGAHEEIIFIRTGGGTANTSDSGTLR